MQVRLENIIKNFDDKKVLKGVNFTFEKGKIYGLLGRNGAGKTTLFNCMNHDLECEGKMSVIEDGVERELVVDDIGYVLSSPQVPEFLTGREFLTFFMDINRSKLKDLQSVDAYFEMMHMDAEDRDRLLKDYSHGMKNKMMMLIHIIQNPNVLLLDEPLTSFDVVVANEMKQLLRQMAKDHILIFSTHIMELALDLCDEIVLLKDGKLELLDANGHTRESFEEMIIQKLRDDEHE